MNCRYVHSDLPRLVCHDRHERGEWCEDCTACPRTHCRVCSVEHLDQFGTCGGCLADTRENIGEIRRLCADLPEEVEVRGVEGEAFNLLGPATDREAWGHRRASILSGRIVPMDCDARDLDDVRAWLDKADHELHPLWVAATWAGVYRDEFGHDEPSGRVELANELGYLERNLTYAAAWMDAPFEDFARDLRRCRAHLEAVLHDGEQVDRGAPCMRCGRALERTWDPDGWRCTRCKQTATEAEYRLAVAHLHREEASWLTDRDMEIRTGVKAGTVRVWALRKFIPRRLESGRVVYEVAAVMTVAREKGLVA